MMRLVPPFRFQLPLTLKLALEASRMFAASPLLFEVVRVPPLKLKMELVGPPHTTLVASSVRTVRDEPPPVSVTVDRFTSDPIFNIPAGELIAPPFVTISVPALTVVLPV